MARRPQTPPGLVDHLGRPIDLGRLSEEHSAPTLSGVRSVLSGHPAQGLTPQRLTALLREAENGSPERYLELAEEMEEKDLHYVGVLGTRKRAVTQLEITVNARSDDARDQKAADMVREWLDRDELQAELFDVLDAIGKGFSQVEIIWDMQSREWTPARLEWRDPRWFRFDPVDGRTPLLVDGGASGNPYGDPLPPFKYLSHQHQSKSGLPIRGGLARAAAWGYLFKNYALKDWVSFAEIFGLPVRVGKYGPGETEENIRRLERAVSDIGADAAAVIPASMMMEFITTPGGSGQVDIYEKLCTYIDRQVSKAVKGETATTDADTGGLGSGAEHGDVRDDIMRSDARQLAATINRDLITPFVRLNHGQDLKPPRVVIGQSESWDAVTQMPAIKTFVEMGGKVGISAVRDKLGFEDPGPDEDLLNVSAAPPPPAFGARPQNAPGSDPDATDDPSRAGDPKNAPAGRLEPFKAANEDEATREDEAAAAAARIAASSVDALDPLAAEGLDDWEQMADALIVPIEALIAKCSSFEELKRRLAEVLPAMDTTDARERLARAGFAARMAGKVGFEITEEDA
jgi:phage gp29-like protein